MQDKTTVVIKENDDGELYFEIPPAMLDELGWDENTELEFEETLTFDKNDNEVVGLVLKKAEKKVERVKNTIPLEVDMNLWMDADGIEASLYIGDCDVPNVVSRNSFYELIDKEIESHLVAGKLTSHNYLAVRDFVECLRDALAYAEAELHERAEHKEFDEYFGDDDEVDELPKKKKKKHA